MEDSLIVHAGDLVIDEQVDARLGPDGTEQPGRFGERLLPGGRFAFLSQGRAVVKEESTAASRAARCSVLRTKAPEPGGASRWVTRIAPDGATTSMVGVPSRCRTTSIVALSPGGTE